MISKTSGVAYATILQYLDKTSLWRIACVCKVWKERVDDPKIWQKKFKGLDLPYDILFKPEISLRMAVIRYTPVFEFLQAIVDFHDPTKKMDSFPRQLSNNCDAYRQSAEKLVVVRGDQLVFRYHGEYPIHLVKANEKYFYVYSCNTNILTLGLRKAEGSKIAVFDADGKQLAVAPFFRDSRVVLREHDPFNFKLMVIFEKLILCYSPNQIAVGSVFKSKFEYISDVFGKNPKAYDFDLFKKGLIEKLFSIIKELQPDPKISTANKIKYYFTGLAEKYLMLIQSILQIF